MLCDHCRKSVVESAETAGWLALTRFPAPDATPASVNNALGMLLGHTSPERPPVERGVHFCSPDCLVAYVRSGMRGLLETAS